MAGLYIHVPFCVRKCRYCDFYSVPLSGGCAAGFLDALDSECAGRPAGFAPDTVFVGGGTPTALDPAGLARLMDIIRGRFDLRRVTEWTVEANPGTLTREKAGILRAAGVSRVSLGVQSFDAGVLAFLGRIHSPADARDAYALLREAGFDNLNLDLIYAVPVGSREIVRNDLGQIAALAPEHVACYSLIFEEGTELTRLRDAGRLSEVDDDEQVEQYRLVREELAAAGYGHYEISNFAKPGRECRHNLLYWSGGEYLGFGPAAHSHEGGRRWSNIRDVERYAQAVQAGGTGLRDFAEKLEPEAKARETLVMGLRKLAGVDRDEFRRITGFDLRDLRGREIDWLCREGMLEETAGRLRLTEKGLFVSDSVFAELV